MAPTPSKVRPPAVPLIVMVVLVAASADAAPSPAATTASRGTTARVNQVRIRMAAPAGREESTKTSDESNRRNRPLSTDPRPPGSSSLSVTAGTARGGPAPRCDRWAYRGGRRDPEWVLP